MASDARARLSEAFDLFGSDGRLRVFHDPDDPLGTTAEGADTPPGVGRSRLRERVAEANARSRGEIL